MGSEFWIFGYSQVKGVQVGMKFGFCRQTFWVRVISLEFNMFEVLKGFQDRFINSAVDIKITSDDQIPQVTFSAAQVAGKIFWHISDLFATIG